MFSAIENISTGLGYIAGGVCLIAKSGVIYEIHKYFEPDPILPHYQRRDRSILPLAVGGAGLLSVSIGVDRVYWGVMEMVYPGQDPGQGTYPYSAYPPSCVVDNYHHFKCE